MQRIENYNNSLVQYLMSVAKEPFTWGHNDCVTFANRCVYLMTGEDVLGDALGLKPNEGVPWTNEREARKAMMDFAGTIDLREIMKKVLPEKAPAFAQRGDILVFDGEKGQYVAVCVGHTSIGPGADGLIHTPTNWAVAAYEV